MVIVFGIKKSKASHLSPDHSLSFWTHYLTEIRTIVPIHVLDNVFLIWIGNISLILGSSGAYGFWHSAKCCGHEKVVGTARIQIIDSEKNIHLILGWDYAWMCKRMWCGILAAASWQSPWAYEYVSGRVALPLQFPFDSCEAYFKPRLSLETMNLGLG